jgi:hypothetical protein
MCVWDYLFSGFLAKGRRLFHMKHIIDFPVPLYGPGTMVIHIPTSGKIRTLAVDPNSSSNDWMIGIEQETGDGYSRPVEIKLDFETSAVDSVYEFVGKIDLPHGRYNVWYKEAG